jgi:hypothetical protein
MRLTGGGSKVGAAIDGFEVLIVMMGIGHPFRGEEKNCTRATIIAVALVQ